MALNILLAGLTLILLLATATIQPYATYSSLSQSIIVLVALLVCLIPTTIGALLSAIGIAGMDRLVQRNVLAMSGRAVEAAGDVSTLLLDKTGTITYGNRMAARSCRSRASTSRSWRSPRCWPPRPTRPPRAARSSTSPTTATACKLADMPGAELIEFTAQTRMSGVDFEGRQLRKGAADSVRRWVEELGGTIPAGLDAIVEQVAGEGGTPLVVADGPGSSASSTSRTRSRRASPSGSRRCGSWASAR